MLGAQEKADPQVGFLFDERCQRKQDKRKKLSNE